MVTFRMYPCIASQRMQQSCESKAVHFLDPKFQLMMYFQSLQLLCLHPEHLNTHLSSLVCSNNKVNIQCYANYGTLCLLHLLEIAVWCGCKSCNVHPYPESLTVCVAFSVAGISYIQH